MKIIDWENIAFSKYNCIKSTNINEIGEYIKEIQTSSLENFYALYSFDKDFNNIIFANSEDKENFSKTIKICNGEDKLFNKNEKSLENRIDTGIKYISFLNEFLLTNNIKNWESFYLNNYQCEKFTWNDLPENLKDIYLKKSLNFNIESFTEDMISEESFYAFYIFKNVENDSGSDAIIILASKDNKTISNYFVKNLNIKNLNVYDAFLKDVLR